MSEEAAHQLAGRVFGPARDLAERYAEILRTRGLEWGLMGPREGERLWERHLLNSAAIESEVPRDSLVIDVGSGAGLPGLPLAILREDLVVTLLEPLQRRATFLELAVDELGLAERVRVVRARAEEHRELYDVVTCRAVAALPKLLGWTTHLFVPRDDRSPAGRLVALKGESAQAEVDAAAADLAGMGLAARVARVAAHPDADATYATVVEPVRAASERPRRR